MFKWFISSSIVIEAPITKVWETITQPSNLNLFHPFCKKNTIVTWPGKDSTDIILYHNGLELERNFFEWETQKGYKLMIGRRGGKKRTEVNWEINQLNEPDGKQRVVFSITLKMPNFQNIPIFFRWIPHYFYLRPKMKKYLDSVVKGFKYYITTGKPVKRNQFGSHSWFSPKIR
jgi:hypothetical protein